MFKGHERTHTKCDILIDNLIEIKNKEKGISLVSNNKTETKNRKLCNALPVT